MADPNILESIWGKRAKGLEVATGDVFRPVSDEDVAFIMSRYPFVQLVNPDADPDVGFDLTLLEASNGWTIHDYGIAISASPGEHLFEWAKGFDADPDGKLSYLQPESEAEEGGEDEGALKPGSGTVVKQGYDVAADIVALVKEKGWESVYLIEGTRDMCWALWVLAEEHGLECQGYIPSEEDEKRRKNLRSIFGEKQLPGLTAKPPKP